MSVSLPTHKLKTLASFKAGLKPNTKALLENHCEILIRNDQIEIFPYSRPVCGRLYKKSTELKRAGIKIGCQVVISTKYAGDYHL